jgi:hypothetical protein
MLLELFKNGGATAVRAHLNSLGEFELRRNYMGFMPPQTPVYGESGVRLFRFITREEITDFVVRTLEGSRYGK